MSTFSVTPLCSVHLPSVATVEKLCFSAPWSETSLGLLLAGNNGGWVATRGESVVGYIGYLCAVDEYEITNVATHPDCRRQGVGAALLCALIAHAKENGVVRITLDVRESNAPAIALYHKFGFTPCGTRKNFYSTPRENAVVMELKM